MKSARRFAAVMVGTGLMLAPAGWCAQQMGGMDMPAKAKAAPSTSLAVTVNGKTTLLQVAELAAMTQKTVTVHNEHSKLDETYSGVELSDVLVKCGFAVSQATHRQMLRSYVTAEGTDKYWVLYSLTEVEGSEHNGDVLVAVSMNGKPLGEDGGLKLVASEDKRPERWVRNLSGIAVKSVE